MFVQVPFFPWNEFDPKRLPKKHYKGITKEAVLANFKPTASHVTESFWFRHDGSCFKMKKNKNKKILFKHKSDSDFRV